MDELLRQVEADPETLGLVLHGSRARGSERPARLERLAGKSDWYTSAFLSARVVVDTTGEVEELVRAIVDAANEAAFANSARTR